MQGEIVALLEELGQFRLEIPETFAPASRSTGQRAPSRKSIVLRGRTMVEDPRRFESTESTSAYGSLIGRA
jgi:hypothetical protein